MNYTNLFKFQFVDREQARATFAAFLKEETPSMLWIDGYKGVGKTSLANYVLDQHPEFSYCYIDVGSYEDDQEIVSAFVEKIQAISSKRFLYSVKEHFKALYQKDSGNTISLLAERFTKITTLVGLLLDIGYYALTYKEEHTDTKEIVVKYIEDVFKVKPLFICIDNFSKSSAKTYEFFSYIIKRCIDKKEFKCCVITDSEDSHWESIHRHIISEYPYISIHLSGLEKAEYFYNILHLIFQMDSFSEQEVLELFNACEGNPYTLSTIIFKLIDQNGVILNENSKPEINKTILNTLLREKNISLKSEDFTSMEKWVLFSFFSIGEKASFHTIKELANYVAKENMLFTGFKEDRIGEITLSLIERDILRIDGDFVEAKNTLTYKSIQSIFENSPVKDVFSYNAYKYYMLHPELPECERQKSYHSFIGKLPKWQKTNFEYGQTLFNQKRYDSAAAVFYRISNSDSSLTDSQKLTIAKCYYEAGFFSRSVLVLEDISPGNLLITEEQIEYYILCGKGYNTTGNMEKACSNLELACERVAADSRQYVELLNLLQMYYWEMPGKRAAAQHYFEEIRYKYRDKYPILWAKAMCGCQNYVSGTGALALLDEAKRLTKDPLDIAYMDNTKGFLCIRANQLDLAKELFDKAAKSIMKLKPHEYSYAANNFAVCCMIQGDYSIAKKHLIKALLWNNTVYGSITIKTHLMMATMYLNEYDECKSYLGDLESFLSAKSPEDEIILRKLHINLAIANKALGDLDKAKNHLESARRYISGTSSQQRFDLICNNKKSNSSLYTETTEFDPWFLIYAHD